MAEKAYTLALWKVKPGRQSEFVEAWKAVGKTFRELPKPPAGDGVLIQSLTDPALHYSFGPWASLNDIAAMREDLTAQESMRRAMDLCTEVKAGGYRVVAKA